MYREIIPAKIREKRGERTRRAVAEAVDGLTEMDIYSYEANKHKVTRDKLPKLLQALGVTFEDISEPVDLGISK